MTRKDRTEGIYSRREVLDESERRQYYLIQLKDLLQYAYRYSEDVKKRFDRAQFHVDKFKTLADLKHVPILKKKELIFLQSMGPRLGGLLTKDLGELKRVFLSPGPIFDPEDRTDDYWGWTRRILLRGAALGRPDPDHLQLPPHPGGAHVRGAPAQPGVRRDPGPDPAIPPPSWRSCRNSG